MAALVGLGLLYRWPAAFVLLKPSVALFALVGIRDRRWWLVAGGLALGSLPFLRLTLEYPTVLANLAATTGPWYSIYDYPLLAMPVIAWMARQRPVKTTEEG